MDFNRKIMTRSELIARLTERFPSLVTKDAEMSITEILAAINAALAQGDRIEIRGFGSFALNYRPPRTGRNPKTEEKVAVGAKRVPPTPEETALSEFSKLYVNDVIRETKIRSFQLHVSADLPSKINLFRRSLRLHATRR